MKLPDLDNLELATESSVKKNLSSTEEILKRLLANIEAFKELEADNKNLRLTLLDNQSALKDEFHQKLREMNFKLKQRQDLNEQKHKNLLRRYEEKKLEISRNLASERERNIFLNKKYQEVHQKSQKIYKENIKLRRYNERMLSKIELLEKKSLANEELLKRRTDLIKREFDEKIKHLAKQLINKEVEYKAQIESLTKDLMKYYREAKEAKENYYKKERDLKEKLKEFLK